MRVKEPRFSYQIQEQMEKRKNDKYDFDRHRLLFFAIGLALTSAAIFMGFRVRQFENTSENLNLEIEDHFDTVLPPLIIEPIIPEQPKPLTQSKPKKKEKLELQVTDKEVKEPEEKAEPEQKELEEVSDSIVVDTSITTFKIAKNPAPKPSTPLAFVSQMPHFKNCEGSNIEKDRCTRQMINSYIRKFFVLPEHYENEDITVYVSFVVDRNGNVTQVKSAKEVNRNFERAAIKAVQKIPNMIPGMHHTTIHPVKYIVPIRITAD